MIEQHASTQRQHFTLRRPAGFAPVVSSIERWSDENYAPQPLDYMWRATPNHMQIIAGLGGVDPQHVQVDLAHGRVILLIAPPAQAGQPVQESYSEVALPPNVRRDVIHVGFDGGFVVINLERKKPNLFQRLKAEISHLRNDVGLVFGKRKWLDDFTSLDM